MPVLKEYSQFDGRHWETGAVCNTLAYQGVTAPHTGKPVSEALLLGVSGGIAFGYFLFEYRGHDPHVSLITRNTFDPMDTLFERLGIPQTVLQTLDAEKAEANLIEVLDSGRPAIVWADIHSLPYNALSHDESNWAMMPVVVFGYEGDTVHIADRSRKPLRVSTTDLARARARVKKDKFRVISLEPPDMRKLPAAAREGIRQCIRLFTQDPPKGAKTNFGFAAMKHWAKMLTNRRNTRSWARFFPPGRRLYAALAGYDHVPGVFGWICAWGAGHGAERDLYADFLDEAVQILNAPTFGAAAALFRQSAAAWRDLADASLPDSAPPLKRTRELLLRRHSLFIEQGDAALKEIRQINEALNQIRTTAAKKFPLSEDEAAQLRERLSEHILRIHDLEYRAVETMQAAIA